MIRKINYFDIFNLKPNFNLNLADLKDRYYLLCKDTHPDKTDINNINIKNIPSIDIINKGYNILKDDLRRAEHLMEIKGVKCDKQTDINFLNKIMELYSRKDEESVKEYCNRKIEKYKREYDNPEVLKKWKYYYRILNGWNDNH